MDDAGELHDDELDRHENIATSNGGGIYGETGAQATIHSVDDRPQPGRLGQLRDGHGGRIFLDIATLGVANSIIALNTGNQGAATDCDGGTYTGNSPNLISTAAGGCTPGEFDIGDPLLERLKRNGGPTRTLAIGEGSPAIGAADPALLAGRVTRPASIATPTRTSGPSSASPAPVDSQPGARAPGPPRNLAGRACRLLSRQEHLLDRRRAAVVAGLDQHRR